MKKLGEEVAYLKGLAEGLDIDDKSKEGKMISKIVEILGYSVVDLEDQVEELQYEVEELQQDVEDLEEWLYDEDEDYDDEDDYDEYDDEEEEDDEELSFIEMECPNCSEIVEIDEELLFDDSVDVVCPSCHAVILSSEDDECGDCDDEGGCCGCGVEIHEEDNE